MKITTPQITWHGGEAGKNDPVLSADVHPCGVLATGGADAEVRLWLLHLDENEESKFQDYLYNFENHQRSVNSVRFSPNGRALATASDGGVIFVYLLPPGRPTRIWRQPKCQRLVICRLIRTTQSDIYDMAWAPTSEELCSVSVDNKVCVWDVTGEKSPLVNTFTSHSNYVQGVCWDPRDEYVVSQSNDRSCRMYTRKAVGGGKKKKNKKKEGEGGGEEKVKKVATSWVEHVQLKLGHREGVGGEGKEEEEEGEEEGEDEGELSMIVPVMSSTPVAMVVGGGGGKEGGGAVLPTASAAVDDAADMDGKNEGGEGGKAQEVMVTNMQDAADAAAAPAAAAPAAAASPSAAEEKEPKGEVGKEEESEKEEEEGDEIEVVGVKKGTRALAAAPAAVAAADAATASGGGGAAATAASKTKRAPRPNLFADETVPSFFRRPAWSPDGCLLLTPTGLYRRPSLPDGCSSSSSHNNNNSSNNNNNNNSSSNNNKEDKNNNSNGPSSKTEFATHVYVRGAFARPALELPHPGNKASVVVRFCPQLFALSTRESKHQPSLPLSSSSSSSEEKEPNSSSLPSSSSLTDLPYRMVFAVLTVNAILVYDTQHHFPLAVIKNSHYAPLTDAAWVADGSALIATSMDGYVTVVCFPEGEIGKALALEEVPGEVRRMWEAHYEGLERKRGGEEEEEEEREEKERRERKAAAVEVAKREGEERERRRRDWEVEGKKQREEREHKGKDNIICVSDSDDEVGGKKGGNGCSNTTARAVSGGKKEGREGGVKDIKVAAMDSDGESLHSEEESEEEEEEEDEEDAEEKEEDEGGGKQKGEKAKKTTAGAANANTKGKGKRIGMREKGKKDGKQKNKKDSSSTKRKSADMEEEEEEEVEGLKEDEGQGEEEKKQQKATTPAKTLRVATSSSSNSSSRNCSRSPSPTVTLNTPTAAAATIVVNSTSNNAVSNSAQKKKRIRPTPVRGAGSAAEDAFAAAAASGAVVGGGEIIGGEEGREQNEIKMSGMEERSNSASAVALSSAAPTHRAVATAGGKPAKKRLAPTLVKPSLN
ncbi:chromatin assembly factor 1 subunit fas2 [Nannochloropsis oceanica]